MHIHIWTNEKKKQLELIINIEVKNIAYLGKQRGRNTSALKTSVAPSKIWFFKKYKKLPSERKTKGSIIWKKQNLKWVNKLISPEFNPFIKKKKINKETDLSKV